MWDCRNSKHLIRSIKPTSYRATPETACLCCPRAWHLNLPPTAPTSTNTAPANCFSVVPQWKWAEEEATITNRTTTGISLQARLLPARNNLPRTQDAAHAVPSVTTGRTTKSAQKHELQHPQVIRAKTCHDRLRMFQMLVCAPSTEVSEMTVKKPLSANKTMTTATAEQHLPMMLQ